MKCVVASTWYYNCSGVFNMNKCWGKVDGSSAGVGHFCLVPVKWRISSLFTIIAKLQTMKADSTKLRRILILTLYAPNKNCSRRHFDFLLLSFKENKAWFFIWILCIAEDSLETLCLIFSEKQWKKYLWMSSAAVVIGALRVNILSMNPSSTLSFYRSTHEEKHTDRACL